MGFFNWAAPVFNKVSNRWSPDTIGEIAGWLDPFMNGDGSTRHVLDVGGGTGALAARLNAETGVRVTVLDPTPEMLAYLPGNDDITGVLGGAEKMPFAADTFDAVIVTDAFHHFRDQDAAAREFQRVVRCGGGVIVVELDPSGWFMRLIVAAEKALGEPGAFFTPEEMCAFFAGHGIDGTCERFKGPSYRFTGAVRRQG